MYDKENDEQLRYRVVISDEGQYSIWPAHKDNAYGWRSTDKQGSEQECLAYIALVWTDMRPQQIASRTQALEESLAAST